MTCYEVTHSKERKKAGRELRSENGGKRHDLNSVVREALLDKVRGKQ